MDMGKLLKMLHFITKCKIGNVLHCTLLLLAGPEFVEVIVLSAHCEAYCLLEIETVNLNALFRTIKTL